MVSTFRISSQQLTRLALETPLLPRRLRNVDGGHAEVTLGQLVRLQFFLPTFFFSVLRCRIAYRYRGLPQQA